MNLLEQHIEAKQKLSEAKNLEMKIRKQIIAGLGEAADAEGTKTHTSLGYKLKAIFKLSRKPDVAALDAVYDDLTDQEKNCVKWSPSIIDKSFKELPKDSKLREIVTVKPGTPSLAITPE
ncbi:MAG: hypothetical protein HOG49_21410 [Candidatus Scalindua sp.]|jgi:hypothetical protein|nr:hypothetical protein [Candidatus Scalindua sp.]